MAFIRVKGHGEHRYAYLAEAEWTKRGPRQKVSSYLGKVIALKKGKSSELCSEIGADWIKKASYKELALKLFEKELIRFGFAIQENSAIKNIGGKRIRVELSTEKVSVWYKGSSASKEKPSVLQINDGFLCEATARDVLAIKPAKSNDSFTSEPKDGLILAKAIVNSGLDVEKELFLIAYEKLTKKELGLSL